MKIIRTLILSSMLPLLLAGKEYTIQLHRPAKVGDQFRVEMTGSESNTMTRKVGDMEDTEEKKWSAKLKGIVTVLKVNTVGSVVQMKLKVDSFTITEGKFTEEALEKGAVIKGEEKDDKNQFELWDENSKLGVPLQDGIAVDALKLLFSLDDAEDKETDDDVFGTKDKKKVGDSWKINAKALAKSAKNDKVEIDPENVTGKMTLAGTVKAGGHKCLEMKGQFTVKGLKPPADFPRNLRVTKSEMTGRVHSKIPVDTSLPEVENSMVVAMIMEVRNRRGQVAMKFSRRAETHTKIELLKPKR
ncbi:MAG: hypothetical protein MK236_08225 [Pedosphaera sp.]|nr:hypothetical protein [Pedosphaera sp.]